MMTLAFIQSTKFQNALTLVSWPGLHFLSKMIPQTLINVLLTVTFRLEYIIQNSFTYSRRLLHTHACFLGCSKKSGIAGM